MRPFRFTAQVPDFLGSLTNWRAQIARLEAIGFSTLAIADHFTGGYTMEPLVTLAAASSARVRKASGCAVVGVEREDAPSMR